MTARVGNRRKPSGGRKSPDTRVEALRQLGERCTIAAVARAMKVREATVRAWRDSPDGQKYLADARAKRAAELDAAHVHAKRLLEENATKGAQAIVDALSDPSPKVRVAAGKTLLDRVGVPVQREMRATLDGELLDLTRLSAEDMLTIERLTAKAKGK